VEFFFHTKTAGERERLRRALLAFIRKRKISEAVEKAVDLALEEHITNVLSHGYADDEEHVIVIGFWLVGQEVKVEVVDDGKAFNPMEYPKPDLSAPAEERPIGGLGIHMMLASMDHVTYSRANGKNILLMFKKLKGSPPAE
jgi:anti-sigma regulatory factor (Ser/Thr protein kinase)